MTIWFGGGALDLPALTELGRGNMAELLDIRFVAAGDDWLAATMPVDNRTRQPYGVLHGGASVVLAETVASVGGQMTCDPAIERVVGMEINANHLRPKAAGLVTAVATCETAGRRVLVWTVRIHDEDERLICLSRVTLARIAAAPAPHF